MRQNLWNDADANAWEEGAGPDPADRLLALRVYSSRLIGADPDLVMHGGGNTSIKVSRANLFGEMEDILHIKGSGWDLDTLEAPGLPGVRLAPLRELRPLERLSDEDMVNIQRANLLDTSAPNPSVETLLHGYLPHRVVDHTHATAFLVLANLPEAEDAVREIFGSRLAIVPFIMPGFDLAKVAADVFEAQPDCEGLVLLQHGHFTWGDTVRESYDRVIEHTNAVEDWLADRASGRRFDATVQRRRDALTPALAQTVLPRLRGAIARVRGDHNGVSARPVVTDIRSGQDVAEFLARDDLETLAHRGPASPDHVIRTKGPKLVLTEADVAAPETLQTKVDAFADAYRTAFEAQNARIGGGKTLLEPHPCVVWVAGVGLVGVGKDAKAAAAASDIAEQSIEVMTLGEAAGGFHPVPEDALFEMEYWSLEQAKLSRSTDKPFTGQIVAVTGGASGIGVATARAFAALGAAVAIIDRDTEACTKAASEFGAYPVAVDLTAPGAGKQAIGQVVERFGGLDILISNAGVAPQGDILTMPMDQIRGSFEINFFAHLTMARAAAEVMKAQGIGGQMLFNVSKQSVNPGKGFGAYGLPKAATFFLVRQLALELGGAGIRVNGLNPDRIRSGIVTDEMIAQRAQARGLSEREYMGGNLLGQEVEVRHVAEAFIALARSERTTGHIMTVDGGNTAAELR
ncbi:MAG: bifunctional aldolase/short-chain dehydrogenase [Pseudomonadota bacterium]